MSAESHYRLTEYDEQGYQRSGFGIRFVVCSECEALVVNRERHASWHRKAKR